MVGEEVAACAWLYACAAAGRLFLVTRHAVHRRGGFVISVLLKQSRLDVARRRLVSHGSYYCIAYNYGCYELGDNK
jgi:hypothetical protein